MNTLDYLKMIENRKTTRRLHQTKSSAHQKSDSIVVPFHVYFAQKLSLKKKS
jgi:hypothetical protein